MESNSLVLLTLFPVLLLPCFIASIFRFFTNFPAWWGNFVYLIESRPVHFTCFFLHLVKAILNSETRWWFTTFIQEDIGR